jgi:hypothetical protein
MNIESTLSRKEFTQHALYRHFRRPGFYIYVSACAILTAYAMLQDDPSSFLLIVAWIPFLIYSIAGWIIINRRARDATLPIYLPTRYNLGKQGIEVSSRQGRSDVPWDQFRSWRKISGVYELTLTNNQILLISQHAISARQVRQFEETLKVNIEPKPEPGVFDLPEK